MLDVQHLERMQSSEVRAVARVLGHEQLVQLLSWVRRAEVILAHVEA